MRNEAERDFDSELQARLKLASQQLAERIDRAVEAVIAEQNIPTGTDGFELGVLARAVAKVQYDRAMIFAPDEVTGRHPVELAQGYGLNAARHMLAVASEAGRPRPVV